MSFNGLERANLEIKPDPILPLNDPGMKLCINVLCAGRPNYLYVCLDSIFRNTAKADVYVYIDHLSNGMNFIKEDMSVIGNFPIKGVFINDKHKGTVANYWYSFDKTFNMGYDYCVLVEEDWLITTDAIQWLYDVPKIASHYSFYRWSDRMPDESDKQYTILKYGENLSWCVGFSKGSWDFFYHIIKAGAYYGLYYNYGTFGPEPTIANIRRSNYIDWDAALIAIMKHYKLLSIVPPSSMLAHFGCMTSNFMGYGSGINAHDRMFNGPPEKWLDNTIEVFNTTTDEEKTLLHFYPMNFRYR